MFSTRGTRGRGSGGSPERRFLHDFWQEYDRRRSQELRTERRAVIERRRASGAAATDDRIHDETARAEELGIPVRREI
jgi:hypothetical protein